jgi:hypothetical protein
MHWIMHHPGRFWVFMGNVVSIPVWGFRLYPFVFISVWVAVGGPYGPLWASWAEMGPDGGVSNKGPEMGP